MNNRRERIAELLKTEIASVLVKSRCTGIITVTCVKVSASLEDATVYYSALGGQAEREAADLVFRRLKREILLVLRSRLHMRRLPMLDFRFDPTPASAARVENILNLIAMEKDGRDEKNPG
ncbi:MAG: ribosome-binding factor A [Elusimicrobiales bacterium]